MKSKLLLLSISVAILSSCSTAYKTGQTPDDVYYSPGRSYGEGTVQRDDKKDDTPQYSNEDREIRMGIRDYRWRTLNDYSYNPYLYGYNYGYYYNPYYYDYPVYVPGQIIFTTPVNTTPRKTNLTTYSGGYNNTNQYNNVKTGTLQPVRGYNNRNTGLKTTLNNVLYPNNNSTSTSNSTNSNRTYTPSSSSSSASSSSSSSGGGVSRPARH